MYRTVLILLAALSLFMCSGCAGNQDSSYGMPTSAEQASEMDIPIILPSPTAIEAQLNLPRRASYVEEDLISHGNDFETTLPNGRMSTNSRSAEFLPEWVAGMGMVGASYCIYVFNAPDYDREPVIHFNWDVEPPDPNNIYFGLGNWETTSWDWYVFGGGDQFSLSSFEAYLSDSGTLALAIISLGFNEDFSLRWVRLDEMPPITASLTATPTNGLTPLAVELDSSLSEPGVGIFVSHYWDWEGDGEFEWQGVTVPNESHTYPAAGEYSPTLELGTVYGEKATISVDVSVADPWEHSWGGNAEDWFEAVAVDHTGVYCAGYTKTYGQGNEDALIVKYALDGSFEWARAFGSTGRDLFKGITTNGNGIAFCAGLTQTYDVGHGDVLLQGYQADGTEHMTAIYSYPGYTVARDIKWLDNRIYVTGNIENDTHTDAFLAKFNNYGVLDWDRFIGNANDDYGWALEVEDSAEAVPKIHLAARLGGPSLTSLLYCKFSDSGSLEIARIWNGAGNSILAQDIALDLGPVMHIYLTGIMDISGDTDVVTVMEMLSPGTPLVNGWKIEGNSTLFHNRLLALNGDLVVVGSKWLGTNDQQGFILRQDTTGTLINALSVDNSGQSVWLLGAAAYPDNGLVVAGNCPNIPFNSWTETSLTSQAVSGNWVGTSLGVSEIGGTVKVRQGTRQEINVGSHDTGGGEEDALVAVLNLP